MRQLGWKLTGRAAKAKKPLQALRQVYPFFERQTGPPLTPQRLVMIFGRHLQIGLDVGPILVQLGASSKSIDHLENG